MRIAIILAILIGIPASISAADFSSTQFAQAQLTDDEIRQRIIQNSINRYSGNCPCPYNRASNGSRCGGRSAYSRPGGASPLCYPTDISDQMVKAYRTQMGNGR